MRKPNIENMVLVMAPLAVVVVALARAVELGLV